MRFAIVTSLTLFRVCAALLVAVVFWPIHAWSAVYFLMLAAFTTDVLDGSLARRWNVVSTFGKIVDPLADKAICLVILWLTAGYYQTWPYILIAGIITIYDIATMSLRLFTKKSPSRVAGASKIAKLKTGVLMIGLSLAMLGVMADSQGAPLAFLSGSGLALLALACVLSVWSLRVYIRQAFGQPKSEEPQK